MSSDGISLLHEVYHTDTVLIHKDDGVVELPDVMRLAASLRTCGDPDCYYPQHLTLQALAIWRMVQASMVEWTDDGCPTLEE